MKRSKHIDLDLMRKGAKKRAFYGPLAVGIAVTALASCSSQDEVLVATSPEECASTTELTLEQCQAAYQRAQAEAERTGPKYTSSSQCETEFGRGQCMQSNTGGFFMPMMTGFMIGRMMSGGSRYGGSAYNPVYRYSNPYSSQNNRIMTADGTVIGKPGQKSYRVNKSTMKSKPSVTRTVSRGGFGATASAKSSWGKSKSSGWGG